MAVSCSVLWKLPCFRSHEAADSACGAEVLRLRGVMQMKPLRWVLISAALGLSGPAAWAFEETKGGVASGQQPAARSTPAAGTQLDLGTSEAPTGKSAGTEVRIPGLGKLGVLPKLDFGLELLYGVNEDRRLEEDKSRPDASDDGVQIRGTVKHRF